MIRCKINQRIENEYLFDAYITIWSKFLTGKMVIKTSFLRVCGSTSYSFVINQQRKSHFWGYPIKLTVRKCLLLHD